MRSNISESLIDIEPNIDFIQKIKSNFTIISTFDVLFKSNFSQNKNFNDIIIEFDSYPKMTGVFISDLSNIKNNIIYIIIFDKHIIILCEEELQQIINKIWNKIPFYYLNSKCKQKIYEIINLPFYNEEARNHPKVTSTLSNMIYNQTFRSIIKKSQIRTQIRRYESIIKNIQINYIKYDNNDFITLLNISSVVLLAFNIKDQYLYILKYFDNENLDSKHIYEHEINFYDQFNSNKNQFISKSFGKIETNYINIVIVEYIEGPTLQKYIEKKINSLSKKEKFIIIIEIMCALEYLHLNNIIYRDLKSDNIIIDSRGNAVLIDFDKIREDDCKTMTSDIGSLLYSSPEQSSSNHYGKETDIYSLGKIIHFVLTGMINNNKTEIPECPWGYEKFYNKYKNCFNHSPKMRPAISSILNDAIYEFLLNQKDFIFLKQIFQVRKHLFDSFNINIQESEDFEDIKIFISYYYNEIGENANIKQSIENLTFHAKQNNSFAQYIVGKAYYDGKYVLRDINKSIYYLTLSSNQNNSNAQYILSGIYLTGIFIKRDIEKAIYYLTCAANLNHSDSQYCLGSFYYIGKDIPRDILKAKHYLTLSANQNNSHAQYLLGELYYTNTYIPRNMNKSIYYLTLSANQNNSLAQYLLGQLYYLNKYVSRDIKKSIYYLTLSANQNHADSQYLLGSIYYNGIDIKQDINKAMHYLTLSANQNHDGAQFKLGYIFFINRNIQGFKNKSIQYLILSANQNNSLAQFFLGSIYYFDFELHSIDKSIYYLTLSANQNNPSAQYLLGCIYYRDFGTKKEIDKSIYYLTLSANQNNSLAQFFLGIILYSDLRIQNINKSIHYLTLSANQNNSNAQSFLGLIYYEGKYIKYDMEKSIKYLTLAIKNNNSDTQFYLGMICLEGIKVIRDINKSIHYLTLSTNQKNLNAMSFLGQIYYEGKYIKRNIDKSIKYLEFASYKGNYIAQLFLGMIYLEGKFIPQDINKAVNYLSLSSYQKNNIAQYHLGKIYYEGKYVQRDINKAIKLLTNSAYQNNLNAQQLLGEIYYEGKYIERNINKSIQFLALSSNQGNYNAQFQLGMIYYEGKYIERDIHKSIQYFKISSSFRNNYAKNNLWIIYKNGEGVKKNIYNAIEYFEEAISQNNDIFSLCNLSRIFYFGIDVEPNIQKAISLLEKLEKMGLGFSNVFLYSIYSFGDKSVVDNKKAEFYIHKIRVYKNIIDSFHKRVFIFFKEIDLVYWQSVNYFSDLLSFLLTGKFNHLMNSEIDGKLSSHKKEKINQYFYEGFYND